MHQLPNKFFAFLLLLAPAWCFALTSDRMQPINIEADHAQLDKKKGITQYKGDAVLTQGTLRITGDIITFYFDDHQQLHKAVAQGKRATYRQIHNKGEAPVKAKALQMEYYTNSQKIYLLGKAHIWRNGDEVTGNRIEYDIEQNLMTANSAPDNTEEQQSNERIHMIIQPPGARDKKTSNPAPVPTVAETTTDPDTTYDSKYPTAAALSNLNVRTGPGVNYQKLGLLKANQKVIVLTRQPGWAQIRAIIDEEVVIGWVSSRHLK